MCSCNICTHILIWINIFYCTRIIILFMYIFPRSLVVFVQERTSEPNLNLTVTIIQLFEEDRQTKKKRHLPPSKDECMVPAWIAARLNQVWSWSGEKRKYFWVLHFNTFALPLWSEQKGWDRCICYNFGEAVGEWIAWWSHMHILSCILDHVGLNLLPLWVSSHCWLTQDYPYAILKTIYQPKL